MMSRIIALGIAFMLLVPSTAQSQTQEWEKVLAGISRIHVVVQVARPDEVSDMFTSSSLRDHVIIKLRALVPTLQIAEEANQADALCPVLVFRVLNRQLDDGSLVLVTYSRVMRVMRGMTRSGNDIGGLFTVWETDPSYGVRAVSGLGEMVRTNFDRRVEQFAVRWNQDNALTMPFLRPICPPLYN